MIVLGFYTPTLTFRGSCVALRDYAHYAELYWGYKSVVLTKENSPRHDKQAFQWLSKRFPIIFVPPNGLDDVLTKHKITILYIIKYGLCSDEPTLPQSCPTVIHCVFDMSQPHGTIYAGVSKTLANRFGKKDWVPHMISMTPYTVPSLRSSLSIPNDAIVFGRHGGRDTFNLVWAHEVISRIVREDSNKFFIFLNTDQWDTHPHIIHLQPITDLYLKKQFIQSCNAMIIPESLGHTFGLSIGEFSTHNLPIICYNGDVWNRAHLDILGDKGIYFKNPSELYEELKTFDPQPDKNWNAYEEYSPIKVMNQFQKVFLDPILKK